jgi:nucleoside-diphosphate-sugar epimerase
MKPTLVTGANGHLGNNICRQLVAHGESVRAMIRASADPQPLEGLALEIVRGDILDADSTVRAAAERDHNTRPITHYVRGKVAAEQEAFTIAAHAKLPLTSIHPGFILGPRLVKVSESVRQIAGRSSTRSPS